MKNLNDAQLHAMSFHIMKLEDDLSKARETFLLESGWSKTDDVYREWGKEGQSSCLTNEEAFYNELRERGWKYEQ